MSDRKQASEQTSTMAAELLRGDLGATTRQQHLDALLNDAHSLQALKLAMRVEPAADTLVDRVRSAPARRGFAWLSGWNLGGLSAASAAAAVMLLAPAPVHESTPSVAPAQQILVADVLTNASFEPTGELFGGDFEG